MIQFCISAGRLSMALILGVAAAASAQIAPAQGIPGTADGWVSAKGVWVIKRQPDTLRMRIELTAKGKNLKDALAKLKTQRDAALARIAKMDAEQDTIKASDIKVAAAVSDRQQQMNMMVRQRMRQGNKKLKHVPEAPPVAVETTVTAEWKLSGADPEARLLESNALETKIRAADLAGMKDADAASQEEREEAEEEMTQATMSGYDDSNSPKPGEPMFMYVAKISKEEQDKAYAAAFADAKGQAERLAKAAGTTVGALRGLSSSATPMASQGWGAVYNRYEQYIQQAYYSTMAQNGLEESPREALGSQVNEVSLGISVDVQFTFGEQGAPKRSK